MGTGRQTTVQLFSWQTGRVCRFMGDTDAVISNIRMVLTSQRTNPPTCPWYWVLVAPEGASLPTGCSIFKSTLSRASLPFIRDTKAKGDHVTDACDLGSQSVHGRAVFVLSWVAHFWGCSGPAPGSVFKGLYRQCLGDYWVLGTEPRLFAHPQST